MEREGPALEALLRRLAECPPDFLAEPRHGARGTVDVAAVAGDVLAGLGAGPLGEAERARLAGAPGEPHWRNRAGLVLVSCWLLADPAFAAVGGLAPAAASFLGSGLDAPARLVRFSEFVTDPDRREELARLALAALGLRPAGETAGQARARRDALDSVASHAAAERSEERARRMQAVIEKMRRQAAEEAAAKVCRE